MQQQQRPSEKLTMLEAARAVAALIVLLMHAANLMRVEHFSGKIGLGDIFAFGYVGVDFFFVLSGFIITYVHFNEIGRRDRLQNYLWRRFSRVYPIYWFILLLSIVVTFAARWTMGKDTGLEIGISDFLDTVLLLPLGDAEPKYVGVAWSLQFEILFYLLFCLFFLSARVFYAAFGVWFLFLMGQILGLWHVELPFKMASAHCAQFVLGIVVGFVIRRREFRVGQRLLPIAFLVWVLAVIVEMHGPFGRHSAEGRLILGLASALLLGSLVAVEKAGLGHAPAWLVRLGGSSYSIYLGHILIVNMTYMVLLKLGLYHRLPESVDYLIAVACAIGVTLMIGEAIEKPLVSRLKNFLGRKPVRAVAL